MKRILLVVVASIFFIQANAVQAATVIDIFGPGQNIVKLSMATPLKGPSDPATKLGKSVQAAVKSNLAILPFMRIMPESIVLGGPVLENWKSDQIDFNRFMISGSDLLITSYWPDGDGNNSTVEIRLFETFSGALIFGKAYSNVTRNNVEDVADQFSADLMESLTGNGDFFRSTIAFAKDRTGNTRDIWTVHATGKDLTQITKIEGIAMSPAWSPDGRYIIFSHIDDSSHSLGVWDRLSNTLKRVRFPGNTIIGPTFLPDNTVAVGLSTDSYPDIYLLDHNFKKVRSLISSYGIDVSPTFDATGNKMVFTSNRLGGPQIFLKDMLTGSVERISKTGSYNTEPSISPDGTLVTYTKNTELGHRIFVYDMITEQERQITFGPGRDEQPSFAPDSYFIAYVSDKTGVKQIYLTTRHGGGATHIPTGMGQAYFPRWGIIPE